MFWVYTSYEISFTNRDNTDPLSQTTAVEADGWPEFCDGLWTEKLMFWTVKSICSTLRGQEELEIITASPCHSNTGVPIELLAMDAIHELSLVLLLVEIN